MRTGRNFDERGLQLRGGREDRARTLGARGPDFSRTDRQVGRPWETIRHPDAARRQRPAGQKTKSCMCPCGARWRSGRLRAEGREARAPRSSGEFREGLLSLSPSWGNFSGATCVRCHTGARGGGGLPRSGRAGEEGSILGPQRFSSSAGYRHGQGTGRAWPGVLGWLPAARSLRLGGLWIRL